MHEELKRIMKFFELDAENKAEHLQDVFKDTVEFFNRFKHTLEEGTAEEKKEIIDEVLSLQEKLQLQTDQMCESMEMSEEELKMFAENPENFTEEEWQTIQDAKVKLEGQASEIDGIINFNKPKKQSQNSPSKKKGSKKGKGKKWVKS
jgi:hypothetical protein